MFSYARTVVWQISLERKITKNRWKFEIFPKNIWWDKKKCVPLQRIWQKSLCDWVISAAGSEHLPYKQRVGGSNPSSPTKPPIRWLFFVAFLGDISFSRYSSCSSYYRRDEKNGAPVVVGAPFFCYGEGLFGETDYF